MTIKYVRLFAEKNNEKMQRTEKPRRKLLTTYSNDIII